MTTGNRGNHEPIFASKSKSKNLMTNEPIDTGTISSSMTSPSYRVLRFTEPHVKRNENGNEDPSFLVQSSLVEVSGCTTLARSVTKPTRHGTTSSFTVSLHIYDLTNGFIERNSEELTGVQVEGIYHSGVVCFGLEFFFEGGVAMASAGCTRFGKKFENVIVGVTTRSLVEFLAWIRSIEWGLYNLSGYHPTEHNCHNFSSRAVEFLTGRSNPLPPRLFRTISDLLGTDVGAGTGKLLVRVIRGVQCVIARAKRDQTAERIDAERLIARCGAICGVRTRPPVGVFIFRVDEEPCSRRALEAIVPYAEQLIRRGLLKGASTLSLKSFALLMADGVEAVEPKPITDYVEALVLALSQTHCSLWGPLLNGLRIAVLHKSALCACVFDPKLLGLLASGARDFLSLTADGRLALLQVLCNLASGVQGAAALNSSRFAALWISAAGLALADYRNSAIVYAGAALAVNMAHAMMLTTQSSLSQHFLGGSSYPCSRPLVTLLLFYLRHWPEGRFSEAVMHMLLLALFIVASSCQKAVWVVLIEHPIRINYTELFRRIESRECRMLVCLLHSLEQSVLS